jgi:hypothetical protein
VSSISFARLGGGCICGTSWVSNDMPSSKV